MKIISASGILLNFVVVVVLIFCMQDFKSAFCSLPSLYKKYGERDSTKLRKFEILI